ncbi:Arabinose efflux permease [Nocardioides sp. J9]|uniref:MFS transporter n=1 Tax=Nocardioides sp. J9 TaxID=935844 RepID=UPI0011ADF014|nr:MFS transporter [Nocardioides sp. J9]TWG94855.1 Arabinose efflux permease [Nocardioides sp. J9]
MLTTLCLCGIVVSLQQTVILPLLPNLPTYLDTTADTASWMVTATLLTGAIATPTLSRLADMYGKRRMIAVALAVSVLGSLVAALGDSVWLLIGARALQGIGMALIPIGIAMMRDELPREKVPLGVAMMSATLAIGAGAALPMSGLIAEHLDWHANFWLTGVVGAVLLVIALTLLPESPVRTRGAFDLRGAVLLTVALTAILLALSKGAQWGWTAPTTLALAAGGLAVLALWAPLELRTPSPLVDLRVAARRAVLLVNATSVLAGFAMFANMLVTTQYLQNDPGTGYGLGLSTLETGLWMVPNAAAFGLMAPVSAALTRRVGPQWTLISGTLLMGVAYLGRLHFDGTLAEVVIGSVVVGSGTAMAYGALPTLLMRAVPVTETASANGLNVLMRSLGTSTASAATAAATTALTVTVAGQVVASTQALHLLVWLAAGCSLGAAAVALPTLRMDDYAEGADRPATSGAGQRVQVVRGRVVDSEARPIRNAVVSVLSPAGESIDWGQADSEGWFNAAIPAPDDYLVVTSADGWQPRSRVMHLDSAQPMPPIVLRKRLRLRGLVLDAEGDPVGDALVVLTRASGECAGTARTEHDGSYEMHRPPNGRYVLTVVAPDGAIGARPVAVWEAARSVDLQIGTPLGTPAGSERTGTLS